MVLIGDQDPATKSIQRNSWQKESMEKETLEQNKAKNFNHQQKNEMFYHIKKKGRKLKVKGN